MWPMEKSVTEEMGTEQRKDFSRVLEPEIEALVMHLMCGMTGICQG
jgi:hypothetical protein